MTEPHILDCCDGSLPESKILDRCIDLARDEKPLPLFRVSDREFTYLVRRTHSRIRHGKAPWAKRAPFVELGFGTTVARVYAAGPLLRDLIVEEVPK